MTTRERLEKNSREVSGCRVWTLRLNKDGYGEVKVDGQKLLVHRVAYALYTGCDIAAGMDIDHICLNRACFAEAHLVMKTPSENRGEGSRRRWLAWRSKRGQED